MISERGSLVCDCKMTVKLYFQIFNRLMIFAGTLFVVSVCGFVLELFFNFSNTLVVRLALLICCGALCFLSVLIFGLNVFAAVKLSLQRVIKNEFYAEYMLVSVFENGQKVSQVKMQYNAFSRVKEGKTHFIAYEDKYSAFPIDKDGLTAGELNAVRKLFLLPLKPCDDSPAELAAAYDGGNDLKNCQNDGDEGAAEETIPSEINTTPKEGGEEK